MEVAAVEWVAVAGGMLTDEVAHFDRPAQQTCEAAGTGAGDGVQRPVEDDAVDVEVGDVGHQLTGRDDGPVGQFAQPTETVVADGDGDQRPRSWTAGSVDAGP